MFTPKTLKYDYGAYAPYVSGEIMELHYSRHYLGYLRNLNNALEEFPEYYGRTIPQLVSCIDELPEKIRQAVRNNGGGVLNHELLWKTLGNGERELHDGVLKEQLIKDFGSVSEFFSTLESQCLGLFGSG